MGFSDMNNKGDFLSKIKFIEQNLNQLSDGGLQREFESIIQIAFESDASIHKKQLENALDQLSGGRSYLKPDILKSIEHAYLKSDGRKRTRS